MATLQNFNQRIEAVYNIIVEREAQCRKQLYSDGIHVERVAFEDIDLEDIFLDELIPLIPEMIDLYEVSNVKSKVRKVYVATLCEMAKNGFSQNGILITMKTYIGTDFSYSRHYKLLRAAFKQEGIEAIVKHERTLFEETIINEAGIPRTFHNTALSFFALYWKWLKPIPENERQEFLRNYIDEKPPTGVYIFDISDAQKMRNYCKSMVDFKEKLWRTCKKLDKVFATIDLYPEIINEENFNEACLNISSQLGFNIQTVVRAERIKKIILEYAMKVSFNKFSKVLQNLPGDQNVRLPNGKLRDRANYAFENYLGGVHSVCGVKYEVSYPIGLSVNEIYSMPRQEVVKQNHHLLYVSDYPFDVEIDGYQQKVRTFIHNNMLLNVYAGRVPDASFVYIDGELVQGDSNFYISAGFRKQWKPEERKNYLSFFINEIRFADKKYAMRPVELCIGETIIRRQTNSNGFMSLKEKWIEIVNIETIEACELIVRVNGEVIEERSYPLEDLYIFGLQSGIHVKEKIDLSKWWGDNRLVIFSKFLLSTDIEFDEIDYFKGYHVYIGRFDTVRRNFFCNDNYYKIIIPDNPYIKIQSEIYLKSSKLCMDYCRELIISIENSDEKENLIIGIKHDNIKRKLFLEDISNNFNIIEYFSQDIDIVGLWNITLYRDQRLCDEKQIAILAGIYATPQNNLYLENELVHVEVKANSQCFIVDDNMVNSTVVQAGKAVLSMKGNLVTAELIELEVYNTKCDLYQNVSIKPNVWGLRFLNKIDQSWNYSKDNCFNYEDLTKYIAFICLTRSADMIVTYNEDRTRMSLSAGYHNLGICSSIPEWKMVNIISITDLEGKQSFVRINFLPRIEMVESLSYNESFCVRFRYIGPIGISIEITTFIDNKRINIVKKTAYCNNFIISVYINNPSVFIEKMALFEGRYDSQDSFIITEFPIQWRQQEIKSDLSFNKELTNTGEPQPNLYSLYSLFRVLSVDADEPHFLDSVKSLFEVGGYK